MSGVDLVTGGSGFIGRHLVRALLARGRAVRVLDLAEPPADLPVEGVTRGSVTNPVAAGEAVSGVERVFHVAGSGALFVRDRARVRDINAGGTETMLAASAASGVRRFIHVSSDVLSFAGVGGAYADSKRLAERAVLSGGAAGLEVLVVRPGAPIGPEDANLTSPAAMLRFFVETPPKAYYDGVINLVDVREVAEVIVVAAEEGKPGLVYPTGAGPRPLSVVLDILSGFATRRMPTRTIPYGVALAAGLVGEATARCFGGDPIATIAGVKLSKRGRSWEPPSPQPPLSVARRPIGGAIADALWWMRSAGLIGANALDEAALQDARAAVSAGCVL